MSRLLRNEILYVICLLPFLESAMFKARGWEAVDRVFWVAKIVSMALCIPLVFMERKKVSKLLWCGMLIHSITFVSSMINTHDTADIMKWANFAGVTATSLAMGEYFLPILKEKLFLITRNLLLIMVLVTVYIVIVYPAEITDRTATMEVTYLTVLSLGYDNRFVFYTTPLVFMAGMYSIIADRRINLIMYLSVIASLFITIATWAVGGFLGTIVLAAGVIIFSTFKLFNSISSWLFFLAPQITNVVICILQIQYYFRDFIENTLKKDITFTGRVPLWDKCINLFYSNPIIGLGMHTDDKYIAILHGAGHAHNEIIDHLLRSGLLGLAGYCIFWCFLTAKMNRIKNGRIRGICNMTFFVQLFMAIADTVGDFGLFYLCYICMYCYSDVFERNEQPLLLSA